MNADAIRYLYEYHFAENRATWDKYVMPLTQAQFTQAVDYSVGSVRNQIVHVMSVDNIWFSQLNGVGTGYFDPTEFDDRKAIRAQWDAIEQMMRVYLAALRDDMLDVKPWADGEDKDLIVWQVLMQVVNHGTDHRAQVLRQLHNLGVKTVSQDFVFYVYDHTL